MSWSFQVENDQVFLTINGFRAKDSKTMEEFSNIVTVDPGRSADEIWVS
jgi:hypothetical protein